MRLARRKSAVASGALSRGTVPDPPATIPENIAIIVTSKVLKNGNDISGNIVQILLVHQDGNYGPAPGHEGNGTVVSVLCPPA